MIMAPKGNKKGSLFLLAALAALIVVLAAQVKPAVAGSEYNATMKLCVRKVVESSKHKGNRPGLVRLLFHDAFVRGLDGSVLLLSTPFNTADFASRKNPKLTKATEQGSPSNGGLRGLDAIDDIRKALLNELKINVSCADAIAFAAREASYSLSNGNIDYKIGGPGRMDGVVSKADEPGKNLPGATFTFAQLLKSFTDKKIFDATDLVALSGAHSMGISHKASYADRVQNSTLDRGEIDEDYQRAIKNRAASPGFVANNIRDMTFTANDGKKPAYANNTVNMSAVGVLDNSFYNANTQNMAVLQSDWVLRTNTTAETLMGTYRDEPLKWKAAFEAAMTKLSNNLNSKVNSEIGFRKKCSATNFATKKSYPKVKG